MLTLRPRRVTAQTGSSDQLSFDLLSLFSTAVVIPTIFPESSKSRSRVTTIVELLESAAATPSPRQSLPFQWIKLQVRRLAAPRHLLAPEMIPQRPTAWLG
jgi:hypothetical protein